MDADDVGAGVSTMKYGLFVLGLLFAVGCDESEGRAGAPGGGDRFYGTDGGTCGSDGGHEDTWVGDDANDDAYDDGWVDEWDAGTPDAGGTWYWSDELQMEGWLCPALFRYYDEAPETLYVATRAVEESVVPSV